MDYCHKGSCTEKLEWCGYPIVKKIKTRSLVLTQCTNVTDRQTDGRTDRQTLHDGTVRAYAEHGAAKKHR